MIKAITSIGLMFITFKFAIGYVPYFWALVAAFFVVIVFRAAWNGIFDPRPKTRSCNCKGNEMEIGSCTMLLISLVGVIGGGAMLLFGVATISHFWNQPPSDPPSNSSGGVFSKAMRRMKEEANRLGINMYRVACVATCLMVFSLVSWGGVSAYNNVTVVPCGKGDVAIKLPDPAKRVMVAAGVPSPCDCGE